jgi:hypothetical protein
MLERAYARASVCSSERMLERDMLERDMLERDMLERDMLERDTLERMLERKKNKLLGFFKYLFRKVQRYLKTYRN